MTIQPIDVEDILSRELSRAATQEGMAIHCSAPPLDEEFSTPHVLVTRTGGQQVNLVIDRHQCSIDVRADTWSDATALAGWVCGVVRALPLSSDSLIQWRSSSIATLPYPNPDPNHPSTPRVTLLAIVACRATIQ